MAGIQLEVREMAGLLWIVDMGLGLIDWLLLVLFLSISLMASAWKRAGYFLPSLLNLRQALICSFKAPSSPFSSFFSLSSFTASEQRPQIHFPKNFSLTFSMYSMVHSSLIPQHSHFAFSTSVIVPSPFSSLWKSNDMSDRVLCSDACASFGGGGGFTTLPLTLFLLPFAAMTKLLIFFLYIQYMSLKVLYL